jgi:hypothetical protein
MLHQINMNTILTKLTYKFYGFWEETGQIFFPVIRNWYFHILDRTGVFEHIWQICCYIQDVLQTQSHHSVRYIPYVYKGGSTLQP